MSTALPRALALKEGARTERTRGVRTWAVLFFACFALGTPACTTIWAFEDLTVAQDASVVDPSHDAGRDVDATMDAGEGPDVTAMDTSPEEENAECANVCNGKCVDFMTDPNHCGSCGNPCASGACQSGQCVCAGPGQKFCGGICINEKTDRNNCGGCSNTAPASGFCDDGGYACPGTQTQCPPSFCADLTSDSNNCGTCGNKCPPGASCQNRHCVCEGTGSQPCVGVCVNTYYDTTNCGVCDNPCEAGVGCQNGKCECTGPTTLCLLHGNETCINLSADPGNCGACGHACPVGAQCTNGTCSCASAKPDAGSDAGVCGPFENAVSPSFFACVNLSLDSNHCGSCPVACPAGTQCQGGQCGCATGLMLCQGQTGPTCVDIANDNNNCGSCGKSCAPGVACVAGACAM